MIKKKIMHCIIYKAEAGETITVLRFFLFVLKSIFIIRDGTTAEPAVIFICAPSQIPVGQCIE